MAETKPKGLPKTGGRQKGTPNKGNINAQAIADELGVDPFKILVQFAAGDWEGLGYESEVYIVEKEDSDGNVKGMKLTYVIPPELRAKCSQEACKYLYPQRKALELSNEGDSGFAIVIKDYSKPK